MDLVWFLKIDSQELIVKRGIYGTWTYLIIIYYYHAVRKVFKFKSPKRNSANLQDLKEVKLIPNFAIVSKIDLKSTPVLMSESGANLTF